MKQVSNALLKSGFFALTLISLSAAYAASDDGISPPVSLFQPQGDSDPIGVPLTVFAFGNKAKHKESIDPHTLTRLDPSSAQFKLILSGNRVNIVIRGKNLEPSASGKPVFWDLTLGDKTGDELAVNWYGPPPDENDPNPQIPDYIAKFQLMSSQYKPSCNSPQNSFNILDYQINPTSGQLTSFAVDFTIDCSGDEVIAYNKQDDDDDDRADSVQMGFIRYHSTIALPGINAAK